MDLQFSGESNLISQSIEYPELIQLPWRYKENKDFQSYFKTKQTVQIEINDEILYNMCGKYQKEYFNNYPTRPDFLKYDLFQLENIDINHYDMIEYFGDLYYFKVSFEYIHMYKKYHYKTAKITVYNIENCKIIPDILKNKCILNYDIPEFKIDIPEKIKYSIFKQKKPISLNKEQYPNIINDTFALCLNLPYYYYSKAFYVRDPLICYDINNKNFWFTSAQDKEITDFIHDVAQNGIYNPLVLKINAFGQLISCEDCNTRMITALYLQLPFIPAIVYINQYNDDESKLYPIKQFNTDANKLFNPYIKFLDEN